MQSWITIAQFLLKINIQRLLCTVIKFQEVLYFGQDFYVNFDRGWQSYGRISVSFTVYWHLNVLIYLYESTMLLSIQSGVRLVEVFNDRN